MKCILHNLAAVTQPLAGDKINTDVVKDSAVLEWECSPQSIHAIKWPPSAGANKLELCCERLALSYAGRVPDVSTSCSLLTQ